MEMSKMKKTIFIVGVGRSGTSLLQSMLNAHPDVSFPPESHFFKKYIAKTKKKRKLEKRGVDNFLKLLKNDNSFLRLNFEPEELLESFSDNKSDFKLEKVYSLLLEKYLKKTNKLIIGDKDPRNLDFQDKLFNYFSKSVIIHIIRDPRDVVLSRGKAEWSSSWPFWLHPMVYRAQLRRGRKLGKKLYKSNYFEIKYENLLTDPEKALKDVFNKLEIQYTSQMLEFAASSKELVSANEMQWKKETLGPLLKNNKNKWLKQFNNWQIKIIEDICQTEMIELDYKFHVDKKTLSFKQRIVLEILNILAFLFEKLYPLRLKL